MPTTPVIKFKVPTSIDSMQNNFMGLLAHEVNKMKHELDNEVTFVKNKLQSEVTQELASARATSQTGMQQFIEQKHQASMTGLTSYINVNVSNYINTVDAEFSTRANKTTVDALDEFARVMQSAFDISYSTPTQAQLDVINASSPTTFDGSKDIYYSYELGYYLVKL